MDENSPDIPSPNSKHHVQHCIQSITNESKMNDLESTTSSLRGPLREKLIGDTIYSNQQKKILQEDAALNNYLSVSSDIHQPQCNSSPTSLQLTQKQRPRNQKLVLKDDNHNNDDDSDYDDKQVFSPCSTQSQHEQVSVRMINSKTSDREAVTAMKTATAAAAVAAEIVSTSDTMEVTKQHTDNILKDKNTIERDSAEVVVLDDLEKQAADLNAALKVARQKTVWMSAWENDMVRLLRHFKNIYDDVMDSVDILVEFDQVMVALDEEKQQARMDKQAQVDQMMNRVAERLFEVEEARQTTGGSNQV
ncbi:unnamed protein product [Absidia cylindrospora]